MFMQSKHSVICYFLHDHFGILMRGDDDGSVSMLGGYYHWHGKLLGLMQYREHSQSENSIFHF